MMVPFEAIGERYDVTVVGARAAGAATAMLLARQGARVLLIDRGRYGSDTLSTHALMRGAVLQLARWNVLPSIQAAGTPRVTKATFIYDNEPISVAVKPRDGVDALAAPRRTVLDRLLVDAAIGAGVEVAYGTRAVDLHRHANASRVSGVVVANDAGAARTIMTPLVVGADGMRSRVAHLAGAPVLRTARHAAANVFGYWSGLPVDGYRWYYAEGLAAGAIPTNDGLTCVFASVPAARFAAVFRADLAGGYHSVVARAAVDISVAMPAATLEGALHGFPGHPGYYRQAAGPGWALVGDAAYFKDPLTAHGITDALIESEYLAMAIGSGTDAALTAYDAGREARTRALFDITDRIASFDWTLDEVRALHKQLAEEMSRETRTLQDDFALAARY